MGPGDAGRYLRLRPSLARVFLTQLLSALAVAIAVGLLWGDLGQYAGWLLALTAVGVVYSAVRATLVRVLGLDDVVFDDGVVSGHSGAFNGGASFSVASIDLEGSGGDTAWRRISGSIVIQSRGAERISMFAPYYRRDELDEMLRLVGMKPGA